MALPPPFVLSICLPETSPAFSLMWSLNPVIVLLPLKDAVILKSLVNEILWLILTHHNTIFLVVLLNVDHRFANNPITTSKVPVLNTGASSVDGREAPLNT